mgnify:FL=1
MEPYSGTKLSAETSFGIDRKVSGEETFGVRCEIGDGYDPIAKANTGTKPTFCSGKHKVIGEDCSTAAQGVTVKPAITKNLPYRGWTLKQPVFDISDAFEGYINPGCASCSLINTADNPAISDPLIEVGKQPKWPVSFALNEELGKAHNI